VWSGAAVQAAEQAEHRWHLLGSSIPSLLERALALLAGRAALSANIRSKRKVAALLGGGTKA